MTTRAMQFISTGVLALLMLASCSSPGPGEPSSATPGTSSGKTSAAPSSRSAAPTEDASSAAPTPRRQAEDLVDALSVEDQAASLVMAGVPATGADAGEIAAMESQGISNVFLRGRSQLSVEQTAAQVAKITTSLEANVPAQLPVWVATDQEGGYVRVLQGAGFTELPTALEQGKWAPDKLADEISAVGGELAEAGINVNLAPVADVVPAKLGTGNAPIGYFGREYAHDAAGVSAAVATVNEALSAVGVQPVAKHFPGLGRVAENTDTAAGVTDESIDAHSADLRPFTDAINQGTSWIMVSNARYAKLDPDNDAPFSARIITELLREDMGYSGIVISDDLCEAKQVADMPLGQRAVKFVAAGGTVPLCVQSGPAIAMAEALAEEAAADEEFAAQVREAAVLILEEKLGRQ